MRIVLTAILFLGCTQIYYVQPDSQAPTDAGVVVQGDSAMLPDSGAPDSGTDAQTDAGEPDAALPMSNLCEQPYVNTCSWNDDEHQERRGVAWVTMISPCAACRHIEQAYYDRAWEMGCCEPWPLTVCPLDGGSSCHEDAADNAAAWLTAAPDCTVLRERARYTSDVVYGGICEVR
jgi:hypothetical protein